MLWTYVVGVADVEDGRLSGRVQLGSDLWPRESKLNKRLCGFWWDCETAWR